MLLTNIRAEQTGIALERLQRNLAAHNAQADQRLAVRVGLAHFDPARPCAFEELVAQADAGCRPDRAEQHRQTDKKANTHSDV
ncbi:MAG: hypothetical protein IT369_21100 [Candidatus Latescibacteria bacterium]|nr:hypothetical protein [Candidatus Latescibacterota bacterium]